MEKTLARILQRKYPELASGWHLPIWASVTDIGSPLAGETATETTPVYAVSVQILKQNGEPDTDIPVISDVLLPVPAGGLQRGLWAKPSVGTQVELAFAYGSPAHPFIRSILPHGLTLPNMAETAQRWQQSEQAYLQVDQNNDWQSKGQNSATDIAENLTQRIGNLREIIAQKHHVGDDSTNIYQLLLDLMNTVYELANVASAHTHNYTWTDPGGASVTSPPLQASSYTQSATNAQEQANSLQPLLK